MDDASLSVLIRELKKQKDPPEELGLLLAIRKAINANELMIKELCLYNYFSEQPLDKFSYVQSDELLEYRDTLYFYAEKLAEKIEKGGL